ncbi:hypothetical protein BCR37DRAFT_378037 [Protomyces lactucae-debilis]|uniref:Uncharacterized protein n=2 Tax=Protomyces lactucae-debilis TaxID=2754530 RepID=A0A1Y2FPB4_PROLT|nr:uncharacterized protein BCR37DRAFT_378037 [Protomyces lactucae-debilis]ORY85046.1 hypothetical protein BCR37DRAFT_378037 [Protomyces lactucae-debilis]
MPSNEVEPEGPRRSTRPRTASQKASYASVSTSSALPAQKKPAAKPAKTTTITTTTTTTPKETVTESVQASQDVTPALLSAAREEVVALEAKFEAIVREHNLKIAALLASISRMETAICPKNNTGAGPPVVSTPVTNVLIAATPPSSPLPAVCVLESVNSGRTPSGSGQDWVESPTPVAPWKVVPSRRRDIRASARQLGRDNWLVLLNGPQPKCPNYAADLLMRQLNMETQLKGAAWAGQFGGVLCLMPETTGDRDMIMASFARSKRLGATTKADLRKYKSLSELWKERQATRASRGLQSDVIPPAPEPATPVSTPNSVEEPTSRSTEANPDLVSETQSPSPPSPLDDVRRSEL